MIGSQLSLEVGGSIRARSVIHIHVHTSRPWTCRSLGTMSRLTSVSATAIAALIVLSACGDEEAPVETASTNASTETTASTDTAEPTQDSESIAPASYECTDPLAGNPTEVLTYDLLVCTTLTLADSEGYATTSTVSGSGTSTLRVNTDPFTVEVTYPDGVTIIATETNAWVNEGDGVWQEGDATSDNYLVAQATQVLPTYRNAHNPAITTAQIPEGTTYTVEGTEVIDGVEYTILKGVFEDSGYTSEVTMWVGSDYHQLKSTTTSSSDGADPLTVETAYTEWDVAQDIEIPE